MAMPALRRHFGLVLVAVFSVLAVLPGAYAGVRPLMCPTRLDRVGGELTVSRSSLSSPFQVDTARSRGDQTYLARKRSGLRGRPLRLNRSWPNFADVSGAAGQPIAEGEQLAVSGYDPQSSSTTRLSTVATNTPAALVEEGTYVVKTAQGEYVGQSGAISRRLQHVASGKFTQAEVDAAERAMVTGGKLQREIAGQLLIDSKGGIDNLLNKVNPIGPKRVSNMPNQPYKR